jgi:predicted transcriptional regulator
MDVGHYFKDQKTYLESFNEIAEQIEAEMNPVSNEIQLEMEV